MTKLCKVGKFIIGIIILFILSVLLFLPGLSVHAANIDEETVLNDLKQDPNFKMEDYLDVPTDYSLQVIQLAETKQNELVVYVYQPSDKTIDLTATKISISYGFSVNGKGLNPKLYDLSLLSTNGVFDKYLIKDYPVPGDSRRYYNIVSIYREYITAFDENTPADEQYVDGEFTHKAYSVGQQWYIYDINNTKAYEMATFDTTEIETILVEHFECSDGWTLGTNVGCLSWCDVWIYCFNCEEYKIEHIFDANVTYDIKKAKETLQGPFDTTPETTYGDSETINYRLTDKDVMSHKGDGLGGRKYEWNRILSSSDFLIKAEEQKVNIHDEVKDVIKTSQWVFSFVETERSSFSSAQTSITNFYEIDNVGVLTLHFMDTSKNEYDLGVVNSLFNPDNNPGGSGANDIKDLFKDLSDFFEKLFLILGIVILVLILTFISNLFTPIKSIFGLVFKAIGYVLLLPIKLVKWAFRRK